MDSKTSRNLAVSPFSLQDDLFFNAGYFLEDMVVEPMRIDTMRIEPIRVDPMRTESMRIEPMRIEQMSIQAPMYNPAMIHEQPLTVQRSPLINMNGTPIGKQFLGKHINPLSKQNLGKSNGMNTIVGGISQQQVSSSSGSNGFKKGNFPSSSTVLDDYEKLARTFQNLYSNNGSLNMQNNGNNINNSMVISGCQMEEEPEKKQFKLPSSKSPIMEALVYCSINKYGIELKELNTTTQKISFLVTDFNVYYKHSCSICSKQSPSEDIRARMKALQRWFTSFPAWRELEKPFELVVRQSHYMKMHEIITKMVRFYSETSSD